jgi:hypothetical protein
MKANTKEESYDTIGLNDEKIVVGAGKIILNENKDDVYQSVSGKIENAAGNNASSGNENTIDVSNIEKPAMKIDFVNKIKNIFNFNKNDESKNIDISSNSNTNNNNDSATSTENSRLNSCKEKVLKKLQDNIEVEKSYKTFMMLIFIGLGMLCLSLVFLPVIILSPYKFVMCFSLGSLIILASFIFIYGTKSYFEILFSKERFPFTLLFLGSIFLGLFFSLGNYFIFSVLCAGMQLITLIVFTLSFIPGGKSGISFIGRMMTSPFTNFWMRVRGQSYLPS